MLNQDVVAVGHPTVGVMRRVALVLHRGLALAQATACKPPPLVTVAPRCRRLPYIDREKFHEVFAHDLSTAEAQVLAVAQKPAASITFEQSVESAARPFPHGIS